MNLQNVITFVNNASEWAGWDVDRAATYAIKNGAGPLLVRLVDEYDLRFGKAAIVAAVAAKLRIDDEDTSDQWLMNELAEDDEPVEDQPEEDEQAEASEEVGDGQAFPF